MSSKYVTTQYNHFVRVKSHINSIYSQAVAYRLSHSQILDKLAEMRATNSYKRLSSYYVGYIAGLGDGLMADIWRNHIVWMLGPSTGPTRRVHTEWTEEMSTLCRQPGKLYGGHFWTDDKGEPTDKVFTEYKATN